MSQGVKVIVYPVKDIARAKAQFRALLGVEPYADQAYYVGFKAGDQDIGLDPNGHQAGATAYFQVDDIQQSLQALVDAGSEVLEEIRVVGPGRSIASVKDADGNVIGLMQQV